MKNTKQFTPRSFAIVGAGPVGCIVAAFLANAGYEVTLCDVVPELISPAADRGIILEGAENLQAKVTRTCNSVEDLAEYDPDVIIIAVKSNLSSLLASSIASFQREGMYVLSWQNGIDTELEMVPDLGRKAVLRGVVNLGCGLKSPCHVTIPFHHAPHFIQALDPESVVASIGIADAFSKAGLLTENTDNIVSLVWRKSILNACMNPVCALTGLTMAEAMGDPEVLNIVDQLVKECVKVARANEIQLGWGFYPYAIEYMSKAGHHKPSMLVDIETRRRTEINFINGQFVRYGKQAGIETPYNLMIMSLVKALENKRRQELFS
ncbi:MAG: 2-dehydropantoate 2-reductase [SAR324 cluster bacterium]|uniref:2-dehydropantoate 2-reductase n=1 Tax=SAR324 cluster bacterium TaxID=2024889 RepID=A0A2A4SSX6_9DELT|nr:MAG: 2-dehydropantoate 2-reductase [SAR324 cluster bacterium]